MMSRIAPTANPIHELLARRWSTVGFSNTPVPGNLLARLFEAARWAPSSYNEQPWAFIVVTSDTPEDYQRLLGCLVEGNREWAGRAPVLVLTLARTAFARNGKPNRHAWHDVGAATENLALQAIAEGLVIHAMAGFYPDQAREAFSIPSDFEPVCAVAIGFPAEPSTLPDGLKQRETAPRQRKPLSAFVFRQAWGSPADFAG